ncbi:phosphoenolpyruvate carboxykinase [Lachnospiraceae bacterium LCP25S3_G4]
MKKLHTILADSLEYCMFTGSTDIERHHVFGGPFKAKSEKYGFIAPLRRDLHPNGVFFKRTKKNLEIDGILKRRCQEWYEQNIGTRKEFIQEFGRNYL